VTASSLYSTNTIAADGGITCKGSPQAFSVYNSGAGTVASFDSVGNLVCGNITGGSLACSGTGSFASVSCNNLTVSNAETDAGTLTVNGLLTANGGISATNATLNGTTTMPSGSALNVNGGTVHIQTNGGISLEEGSTIYGTLNSRGTFSTTGIVSVQGTGYVSTTTLTASGQITAKFPVHLSFYGKPSLYNSSGTLQTVPNTTFTYYYCLFPSYNSLNWTPSYTNSCRLAVPYEGLYALQFSMQTSGNRDQFISKNLMNNADGSATDDKLMSFTISYTGNGGELSQSATAYLRTTDYINCGFALFGGSTNPGYSTFTITLLQRTA
jgi:hypothetical protein